MDDGTGPWVIEHVEGPPMIEVAKLACAGFYAALANIQQVLKQRAVVVM